MLLRKPTPEAIQRFLDRQRELDFTYQSVGATANKPPDGYVVDHTRVRLGEGDRVFATAKSALKNWQHFRLGWVSTWPDSVPIRQGEVVAVLARSLGLWWLNACRIVYVIDEDLERPKFGFAYGTLPGHAESGEEKFVIEMDDQEVVWYDILAFSRPQRFLSRLGYLYVRRVQKRFGRHSAAAMRQAVNSTMDWEAAS